MKKFLFVIALAFTLSTLALGQASKSPALAKIEQEIADLEKKIEQAQMAGDLAALNKLVAVDMIYNVGNPPSVLSREQIERRWAAKKEGRMGVVVESDVVFRVYGNTVLKNASFKRVDKTRDGKEATLEGRHTNIYVKMNGQWKWVGVHGTPKVEVKQ